MRRWVLLGVGIPLGDGVSSACVEAFVGVRHGKLFDGFIAIGGFRWLVLYCDRYCDRFCVCFIALRSTACALLLRCSRCRCAGVADRLSIQAGVPVVEAVGSFSAPLLLY